jgi:hypothetical protein
MVCAMSFLDNISKAEIRGMLTGLLVLGAISLLVAIFLVPIPDPNRDMAYLFVGGYLGWTGSTVNFWFGTSKGSADKQDELNKRNQDG